MATTMRDVISEVRRKAYGSLPDVVNLVGAPYVAGSDELELVMDVTGIQQGTILSCGLNTWMVRDINQATKVATVIPNMEGSPGSNASEGEVVFVAPRMTDWFAFAEARDVITNLSSPLYGLYRVGSWTVDVDPVWQTYDVPSNASASIVGMLGVRVRYPSSEDSWVDLSSRAWNWVQDRNVVQLHLDIVAGTVVEFTYRGVFAPPTALTDDLVEDCGLPVTAQSLPALGVLASHYRATEGRRNQVLAQGDPRRAEEVRSGSNITQARVTDNDFIEAVNAEVTRQIARYGYRKPL